jgi:predicted PurR-regulated permease PerM
MNIYALGYIAGLLPLTVSMIVVGTVFVYLLLAPVLWLEKGVLTLLDVVELALWNRPSLLGERKKLLRFIVLSTVYFIGLYAISIIVTQVVPMLKLEALAFLKEFPYTLTQMTIGLKVKLDAVGHQYPSLIPIIKSLPFIESYDALRPMIWRVPPAVMQSIASWFQLSVGEGNVFLSLGLTRILWSVLLIVYVFYALLEGQSTMTSMYTHLPIGLRQHVQNFADDLHQIMLSFVQGQVFLGLLTGLYMFVIYSVFGVHYALLLASIFAIAEILPVVGTYIGFTPALLMIALTGDFATFFGVFASSYLWQTLKDNIIQPQLFGNALGMHPVFIIVSLIICGKLAGVLGILLAIPLAAITLVTLKRFKTFQFTPRENDTLAPTKTSIY